MPQLPWADIASDAQELAGQPDQNMMKAVVLAAGLSRRFGTGEQKALSKYAGKKLVHISLEACLPVCDVIVVTGHESEKVSSCVSEFASARRLPHNCGIIFNPLYASGQFSSCIAGLREVEEGEDFLFVLCDTPNLDSALVRKAASFLSSLSEPFNATRPMAGGIPVHPVAFKAECRPFLLEWEDRMLRSGRDCDVGLRDVLRRDKRIRMLAFDSGDAKYAKDVDFMSDLGLDEDQERRLKLTSP